MRFTLLVIVLFAASLGSVHAESGGAYTSSQARFGETVYTQKCSVCHGANLQGESGTPSLGPTFSQAYGAGTAAQLYDFISRQMPLEDAPGTLSQQQYLAVTAYILSKTVFPPAMRR
jgi:alcohol dehydrogenase (cytochrome c)